MFLQRSAIDLRNHLEKKISFVRNLYFDKDNLIKMKNWLILLLMIKVTVDNGDDEDDDEFEDGDDFEDDGDFEDDDDFENLAL